ncbi:phospholipase D-like domain-containing protein [Myxococcus qinghaiensis]|uniref:hypothetical protein n=1 Tax=Myxococcus qinghaiensis TaxID=2906758 RepID=UPI0020A7533E|nr:hypothetical protein [Myxococcus qinghaiensis]MCP3169338.1 hypothetical protein [Myxococcus qinghaiensis]
MSGFRPDIGWSSWRTAHDARFVRELGRCWEKDLAVSKEISLEKGGRTNPWRRLARQATQLMGHTR